MCETEGKAWWILREFMFVSQSDVWSDGQESPFSWRLRFKSNVLYDGSEGNEVVGTKTAQ